MKIEIELSKDVNYPGEILGEYIWNLEEGDNHVMDFAILLKSVLKKSLDTGEFK